MSNYKNKHRLSIKTIALVVLCLFAINNVVLANTTVGASASKNTLAVQSSFQALINEKIEVSLQTQFEILAGIRLLLAGKNYSAVNGLLLETYGGGVEQGKSNIEFLPETERNADEGKAKARFIVKGREDVVFEIEYTDTKTDKVIARSRQHGDEIDVRNAGLQEVLPLEQLHWGNVFQEGDGVSITKIDTHKEVAYLLEIQGLIDYINSLDFGDIDLAERAFIKLWNNEWGLLLDIDRDAKERAYYIFPDTTKRIVIGEKGKVKIVSIEPEKIDEKKIENINNIHLEKYNTSALFIKSIEANVEQKTVQFIFGLVREPEASIETVGVFRAGFHSICVSSATGCKNTPGCKYCKTGEMSRCGDIKKVVGLNKDEFADQIYIVRSFIRDNILEIFGQEKLQFSAMGMGEPLMYVNEIVEAIDKLEKERVISMAIISTTGNIRSLEKMEKKIMNSFTEGNRLPLVQISAQSSDENVRRGLVHNPKYLSELKEVLKFIMRYYKKNNILKQLDVRVTLMKGINDSEEDAIKLAETIFEVSESEEFNNAIHIKINQLNPIGKYEKTTYEQIDTYASAINRLKHPRIFAQRTGGSPGDKAQVERITCGALVGKQMEKVDIFLTEQNCLCAENNDENYLLTRASRHIKKYPVNMHIDLTTISKEEEQLKQNMETLALLIAWHNTFGLNVRYVLENDIDGRGLEILKGKLSEELVLRVGSAYVAGEIIETQDGEKITVKENELIDIRLENIEGIKKDRKISDREYIVALKDDASKPGISIPNYTAAAAMGLSLSALRVARDKLEEQPDTQKEYEQFRSRILDKFRDIYERYDVVANGNDFSEDELELMVMGSSATKLYYAVLYALPPVIKVIEEIHKYHEMMRDVLIAA